MSPHRSLAWSLSCALLGCSASAKPPTAQPQRTAASISPSHDHASAQCLSIVSWNDLHGHLRPEPILVDTNAVPVGGVVALADQIAQLRATGDTVVVLDAGDLFTGPLESSLAEGAPVLDAYAVLGLDAAAIGNHEFDFGPVGYDRVTAKPGLDDDAGPDGPRGALFARMQSASFPFLSANLRRRSGQALRFPNTKASIRISRDGFQVGIVGYTTQETPSTTLKPNTEGLDFANGALEAVRAEIKAQRTQGSSPVVLLAHASADGEIPQDLDAPSANKQRGEIPTLLSGLGADLPDLVIAGHRHAWMLGRVNGVPIVSTGQHGIGLARSRFCRTAPTEAPRLVGIERRVNIASTPAATELGNKVQKAVSPWLVKVRDEAAVEVANVRKACAHQGLNGTATAEQIARAIAERVGDAKAPPKGAPVVALVNSGGIRASIPAGPLSFGSLYTTFPFENAIAVCATTRVGLTRLIANALKKPSVSERFPFGIAGARVHMKRTTDGVLEVARVQVTGEKDNATVQDDAPIWLALPDFILWDGDGLLTGVTCRETATSQTRVRDAWRSLLARERGGCDGIPQNLIIQQAAPH